MVDISIIIPTIRDPLKYLKTIVSNIKETNCPYTYEILSGGRVQANINGVRHFYDPYDSSGCAMYNYLYTQSTGEYIVVGADKMGYRPGWWKVVDELKSDRFKNKKFKILGLYTGGKGARLQEHFAPRYPDRLPTNGKHLTARFPVFHRSTIDDHLDGYIWNPCFKSHHLDIWLGHYLSKQGEPYQEHMESMTIGINQGKSVGVNDMFDEIICWKLMMLYETGLPQYQSYGQIVHLTFEEIERTYKYQIEHNERHGFS